MLKWAHYARKLDIGLLCPNMEIRPRAPKMEFSKFFHFWGKVSRFRFQRALNHPPTLSLSQVMQENVILAYYAQIWKFGPRLPKMEFLKMFSFLWKGLQISLLTSPQPPPDIKLKSSYARKRDYAQIWKFSPRLPKMEFFKIIYFFEKVSRFRFQRALNHPQILSLSQVMQENVILAYYAQIWEFGPRLPKMEFFKKISFFCKGLLISLLTSPQPPADIKFKSSYARKHIIKKVESRTQLLNPEWMSYQSFT